MEYHIGLIWPNIQLTIETMKTFRLKIVPGLLLSFMLSSCSEDTYEKDLTVSETMLSVEAAANSETTFQIKSNEKFVVIPSVDWLDTKLVPGDNGTIVTLTAKQNAGTDIRTAKIIISAQRTGATTARVNLTQK